MYRLHIVSTGIEIFCHFVASEEEEEEENWVSSHCRSICRKNAFNWRRERIVQWVKNESEWEAAEVATERMHSIEEGKGLFSRGRMECEWEEERFLTLMLLQESIQIKVDATAAAGRMLDFCRRKEDQVRTVLSRVCFICLVFPCIMILQHIVWVGGGERSLLQASLLMRSQVRRLNAWLLLSFALCVYSHVNPKP
jgi:hypothetical protein